MCKYFWIVAAVCFASLPTASRASSLVIPTTTVLGTDVFSGPMFTVSGTYGPTDTVNVIAAGTVDLGSGTFTANAAGVIVAPPTTNTGNHPGETASGPGGFPFASLLIGNGNLGFFPLFPADASTGLGNSTPPTTISEVRTLGDIFGPSVSITNGTVLELLVNDTNPITDNSGAFLVSSVPEPSTLAMGVFSALALSAVASLRHRSHARS
jgi:hypothetical protein